MSNTLHELESSQGMLLLSRSLGESIICTLPGGQRIKFKVLSRRGNEITIGICAPKEIEFYREEIQEKRDSKGE
jgi:carbon storage regulator CsrA